MRAANVFLVLLALALVGWLFSPLQPRAITRALQRGQTQFAQQRTLAADPATNGYLAAEWQELWAPRTGSSQPHKLVFLAKAAGAYSPDTFPDLRRLQTLARSGEPHLTSTLKSFEAIVPGFQREWVKPAFVPIYRRASLLNPLPNMSLLGELAKGCAALAYQKNLQGEVDDAVRLMLPPLRLSTTLIRNGSVTSAAAGLSLRRVPLQSWLRTLQTGRALNPQLLQGLLAEIRNDQLAPDELEQILAGELLASEEFFRFSAAARSELQQTLTGSELRWLKVPGMLQRDRRIFHRRFAGLLGPGRDHVAPPAQGSWFLGQRSLIGQVIFPNVTPVTAQLDFSRHELAAVHALFAIRLFRLQNGRLPAKLAEMPVKPLPGFEWESRSWTYNPGLRRLTISGPGLVPAGQLYREGDIRAEVTPDGLTFPL